MNALSLLRSVFAAAVVAAPSAFAQSFVETFTGNTNTAGWTWGNGFDVIESSGGNPGYYLHNPTLDTFAPWARSTLGTTSAFTGDYRARRVTNVGVDVAVFAHDFNYQRELTLMLRSDSGTPGDPNDDCYVYMPSATFVPYPADGWRSFDYAIPSQQTTLPAGWNTWSVFGNCPAPDVTWNNVITNVTEVSFFFGDPTFFYIFMMWNLGLDNPRIEEEPHPTFCFGDGTLPTPCPCVPPNVVPNPPAAPGHGCANSQNLDGALLGATGATSPDNVTITAFVSPVYVGYGILMKGNANAASGIAAADGIRCVDGQLIRFGGHNAGTNGAPQGYWTYPNTVQTNPVSVQTAQPPGQSAYYQLFYRNTLANFCTSATTNWSNGVQVDW
jgi:hypothetical protein